MGRIGLKAMASFCKQSAVSIRSGLTLSRAFPLITDESSNRLLRNTFRKVSSSINEGHSLTEALQKERGKFPPIFVEMVAAGERTGHLEEVFERLSDYFDTRVRLRRAVIKASVYPMIQLTTLYAVVCLLAIVWSSDRRAMALTLASYTLAALVVLLTGYYFFSRTVMGRAIRDRIALAMPVVRSLTIKLSMARFIRTLALQMESAIPVAEAIERSALVTGNGAVASSLKKIADPIQRGESLVSAIKQSRFVTPMIREVLTVAEETGNFGETLERVADLYEEESLSVLEALPKFIGPTVVILVGIAVLYLIYTVYILRYLKPLLEGVGM